MALVVASAQDGSSAVSPLCHQGRKAYVVLFILSFPSSSCAEVKVDRRLQAAELLFRRHTGLFTTQRWWLGTAGRIIPVSLSSLVENSLVLDYFQFSVH